MKRILNLLDGAKDHVSVLEKEYLYRYHNAFNQLINLNKTKKYFQNIKTIYQFYKRIIANEKLSFQGEPLNGLQLMGMLENVTIIMPINFNVKCIELSMSAFIACQTLDNLLSLLKSEIINI